MPQKIKIMIEKKALARKEYKFMYIKKEIILFSLKNV